MPPRALPALEAGPRAAAVADALGAAGHGVLLVSNHSDIRWLTGFSGSSGWAVVTAETLVLVTDGRYADQAAAQLSACGVEAELRIGLTQAAIREHVVAAATRAAGTVAADGGDLSYSTWTDLSGELGLVEDGGTIRALRRRKEAFEVARIELAAAIAELSLGEVLPSLALEPTEADVRDELDYRMRRHGADGPSYDTIVGSGPAQSARPHHLPNARRIVDGDSVVIDVGALVDGYHSDMTRTFHVGDPPDDYLERYAAVLDAQAAGLEALAPGIASTAVDGACRDHLTAAGLGEWFVHGTGHGVGLDIHEDPFLRSAGVTELAQGDVVTVEPGVYRDGSGGIRIEDLVTITADGHRSLTTFRKDSPCLPSPPTT